MTDFTRMALAVRRQHKRLTERGYRRHETDWEVVRGGRQQETIVDVQISMDGKHVYTLLSGAVKDGTLS